jgi:hypothetical protein
MEEVAMGKKQRLQLSQIVDHTSPAAVLREAAKIFCFNYRPSSFRLVHHAGFWISRLFTGGFPGYKPCNTEYHDLGHTLDVLLATARIVDGYVLGGGSLSEGLVLDLYLAALLHDTGYIQQENDRQGTGAKYTETHVDRSVRFTLDNARFMKIPTENAGTIGRLIHVTNLNRAGVADGFKDETERTAGALLATADLLGQMADRAYLEKLIFLYRELKEAGIGGYDSEFDILKKTMDFYKVIRERLGGELRGMYAEATAHFRTRFGIDRNLYMESIERQMDYLSSIISDDSTNFRKKLKRLDLESIAPGSGTGVVTAPSRS